MGQEKESIRIGCWMEVATLKSSIESSVGIEYYGRCYLQAIAAIFSSI
jgi:hypothetical protein